MVADSDLLVWLDGTYDRERTGCACRATNCCLDDHCSRGRSFCGLGAGHSLMSLVATISGNTKLTMRLQHPQKPQMVRRTIRESEMREEVS